MTRHEGRKNEPTETSLANQIREAVKESGLSVYELAKMADVDQSNLNRFLNGTRENLTLQVVERLFSVLGLTLVRNKPTQKRRRTSEKPRDEMPGPKA
jgi:transcriptional regulator with XRE-family HTH domain